MKHSLAAALLTLSCSLAVPAMASAQIPDQAPVAAELPLNARMTAPAGALWAVPVRWVRPTRGVVLPGLYVSLVGLQAYDGYSTIAGLRNGDIEGNSFMIKLAAHPSALWAVKGAMAATTIYIAERLWRENRRGEAIAMMVVSNGLMLAVAASNASILRAQK